MKTRFNTYDLVSIITELQPLIGMRVNQVYDIDHRTYLIRLQRNEEKRVLLIESGNRFHTTAFEWPKNVAPSGFSMKMRKHLKNKRLESLKQIGADRIVDFQFGSGEAAYHIILELYDRGNIILTDYEMTILNVLRPHTEGDKIRFAVREKYPLDRAHKETMPEFEEIKKRLQNAKQGEPLKKILNLLLEFGASLIDHVLLKAGFINCKIGQNFHIENDLPKLHSALMEAELILNDGKKIISKGYIVQKKETKITADGNEEFIYANIEFHPYLFEQIKNQTCKEFDTFDNAVDEYFSSMEGQKLELKVLQQERDALKKLDNVRKDHDQRLISLTKTQDVDKQKAELIARNQELVDGAIVAVQSLLAHQFSWPDIEALVKEAQDRGDPIAQHIKQLKLQTNHISLLLTDPYNEGDDDDNEENENNASGSELKSMIVDINLAHSAFANATKYYDLKRTAAKKQQKTIESQGKALKSAERKTKQTLKEVQTIHSINKLRKVYWFEKFYWFISSENYLVIGGRDQQQNELIVKRYLRAGDVYVHADLTGASSVVIKNPNGAPIPPKTLAEAGTMAVTYSIAWEAKVVAGAWWVNNDQVSKTAPTGEYLTTGSFMIRGKKNYLPPCQLVMGLGFMFRLEESSIERHKDERKVKSIDDENEETFVETEKEIEIEEGDDEEDNCEQEKLDAIQEVNEGEQCREEKNEEESSDDENSLFPDTKIKIDLSGSKMHLRVDNAKPLTKQQNEEVMIDEKPQRIVQKKQKGNFENRPTEKLENEEEKPKPQALKRGQKGKLKKIKEKYKDQDEEDRRLLMAALQSAGAAKEDKRKNRQKDPSGPKQQKKKNIPPKRKPIEQNLEIGENIEEEDLGPAPEIDMLDQLTGKPVEEDELLFAVPIIAPYNTLTNYKFKVKLTPGTGKRGKAAKTAVAVFLKDKTITSREKDLIKSVKDETIARNIPGKVKISAPQIQKVKK
ncbi:ribosome quality control complex subunit NEMF homolog [Leptopilina boulardi]|uniref:ribosome quality control complex subunit NEMF homolog n=1 Tax=Leptopilina boulardi TaxID=63433 RepID=UPI0021F5D83C|nr:ribosome quality control complex subunit NEMF homolog [Leptopilina boulardi]